MDGKIGAKQKRTTDRQQQRTSIAYNHSHDESTLASLLQNRNSVATPRKFTKLIKAEDRVAIGVAITNEAVEQKVLERLGLKARTYGTDPSIGAEGPQKIKVDAVVRMYKDFVIPLTKEVEVEYLMQRLDPGSGIDANVV